MKRCLAGLALAAAVLAAQPAPVSYLIETVAGSSSVGDGGPAGAASLSDAQGVAVDAAGNIYVSDANDHRVRKITPGGLIFTVAGTGAAGFSGDGGPATAAQLNNPYGIALDGAGNLYVADLSNHRVRRVSPDGVIRTLAPDLAGGWLAPRNIALDATGNLYVAEFEGHRIRKLAPDGTVSLFAGTGAAGYSGDGGPPGHAQFAYPAGLAFDARGNLYVADSGNHRVREITYYGVVTTVLGTGIPGNDDSMQLNLPTGVAVDSGGNLYVADSGNQRIRKRASTGQITTYPGAGRDLVLDGAGNLYIASGPRLVEVTVSGEVIPAAGGNAVTFRGDGGPATRAVLNGPAAVAAGPAGEIYIADSVNQRVRKVDASGVISTVSGDGTQGLSADQLSYPSGLALDPAGNLYIADQNNDRVQKRSAAGIVTTTAGTGMPGFSGDGLPAASSQLYSPAAVAIAGDGTLLIADAGNRRIRSVDPGGTIHTLASGIAARGIAADAAGNVYVSDTGTHRILAIDAGGALHTVAGTGVAGFSGDGAHALGAQLNQPRGLAVDAAGNLLVADSGNHRVRAISPDGTIRTLAGNGIPALGGDGGPALEASLNSPAGLAPDANGSIWIADSGNSRVRKLSSAVAAPERGSFTNVVNAASFLPGPVAPGEIVSVFGAGLGPATGVAGTLDASGRLSSNLAGVQVRFDGQPAPLYYVQHDQINAQVPYTVVASTRVEVLSNGVSLGQITLPVADAAPGIFTVNWGTGQAAAVCADGSLNSSSHPAARGSTVTLYATGEGQTVPPGIAGRPAAEPEPTPALGLSLTVGGVPAEILSVREAAGFAGLLRMDVLVPAAAPAGMQEVVLQAGQAMSQRGVTIALR